MKHSLLWCLPEFVVPMLCVLFSGPLQWFRPCTIYYMTPTYFFILHSNFLSKINNVLLLYPLFNGFDPVQYTIWPPPTFSSCIRIFHRKSIIFCFYTLFLMVLTPYNIRYDIHSYSIVIKWFFIFLDIFKSSVLRCMSSYGARDFAVSLEISKSFCMHTLRRTIFSPRDREIF